MIYLANEIVHYKEHFLITRKSEACNGCSFINEFYECALPNQFKCLPNAFPWHDTGIIFQSIIK